MFALQVLSILAACTYMVTAVPAQTANIAPRFPANKCPRGQFYYRSICLPTGGPKKHSKAPADIACPRGRYWHTNGFCAPLRSIDGSKTTCAPGYKWNEIKDYCKKTCTENEFFWKPKSVCLPIGGPDEIKMSNEITCPRNWFLVANKYCAPLFPGDANQHKCSSGHTWDGVMFRCVKSTATSSPVPDPSEV